jgi:hypothetical protein
MAVQNEKGEGNAEISFGTGNVAGDFYRDKMCIGDSLCIDSSFIAADRESTEPFQEIPFDGIMGLGFKDLSMGKGFNIIDDLYAGGQLPAGQISFYLTDDGDSEVTFGGYKSEYLASDILWARVDVESYWQVSIDDITFDNKPKNLCGGGCNVAVDTGTSMLAGPSELVDKLTSMLNAKEDCSNFNSLPRLGFQIGDKVLNLKPDDYMDSSGSECSLSFMSLDVPPPKGPLFIFGDPFLRRFVTIFDRAGAGSGSRVGFAVAKHSDDNTAPNELISHVGASSGGDAGAPPSGGFNANAVNLHLDSGLMGPGQGSDASSDDSTPTPAPAPVAPPPPPPAWVPPPSPPAPQANDISDPFSSTDSYSSSSWSADSEKKVEPKAEVATPAPSASETPAFNYPTTDYEKLLFGGNNALTSAVTSPVDHTQNVVDDVKPVVQPWDKTETASSNPFDEAQKLIDAAPAVTFEPKAEETKPAAMPTSSFHVDTPDAPALDNSWMSAFDEPAAAAPVKLVKAEAKAPEEQSNWYARWHGSDAVDNVDSGIKDALSSPWNTVNTVAAPAKVEDDAPVKPARNNEDAIDRMSRLFKENSLLQKSKKGHMVSIKLHRGK